MDGVAHVHKALGRKVKLRNKTPVIHIHNPFFENWKSKGKKEDEGSSSLPQIENACLWGALCSSCPGLVVAGPKAQGSHAFP